MNSEYQTPPPPPNPDPHNLTACTDINVKMVFSVMLYYTSQLKVIWWNFVKYLLL